MAAAETKVCQNCKSQFTIEPEDFDFYKKIDVPPPTWCPECRMIRRWLWRNERNLFRRKDAFGKEIFSGFPLGVAGTIYEINHWRSDVWNAFDYSRDYDFSRSFFEQFRELFYAVPWPSRGLLNEVNSDYSNEAGNIKNCYLTFNADFVENCMYSVAISNTKDCADVIYGSFGQLSYGTTLFANIFKTNFSINCIDTTDVWCSQDLVGCSNCIGCVGLRKKSYYIFNKPYSKEDYEREAQKLGLNTYSGLQVALKKMHEIALSTPVRYLRGTQNVNSTGEYLTHTKNCKECWSVIEAQDLKYCQMAYRGASDCYDYSVWGDGASRIYESVTCGYETDSLIGCFDCWPACQRLKYSIMCRSSSDLFGCVGLKKAQYCILNKQYSKEQYGELIEKIRKQMSELPYKDEQGRVYGYGEFFPPSFSPYAYNETQLQDLFPLTQKQAESQGYLWREPGRKEITITVQAGKLPDDINVVTDDILKHIIGCTDCGKAYRVIPTEFQFLKNQKIPLPRQCPECRIRKQYSLIHPPVFYSRQCMKCRKSIRTAYAPDRPEVVYCETCYQDAVS